MLKYLDNIAKRFEQIKKGIEINKNMWQFFPGDTIQLESHLNEVIEKDDEIESLKKSLAKKFYEARKLRDEKNLILTRLEKRAIGIHADEPGKLKEYGINNNK
jgi:hypothetical protein